MYVVETGTVVRIRVRRIVVRIHVGDTAIRIRVVVRTLHHTGTSQTAARFSFPRCRGKEFDLPSYFRELTREGVWPCSHRADALSIYAISIFPLKARREP